MPRMTLEAVRDRYRQAAVDGPPVRKPSAPEPVVAKLRRTARPAKVEAPPPVDPGRTYPTRRTPRYTLTEDRDDAILAFSAHKGRKVSELANDESGRGFLQWLSRQDFPDWPTHEREELQTLARAYLGLPES